MLPFFFHRNEGETPPLTGVAVRLTGLPVHTGLAAAAMETLTGSVEFTPSVTALEVAGLPDLQFSMAVSTQVITSPFAGV